MSIADADVKPLVRLLSEERLRALVRLTGSELTAVILHQEILQLGARLMAATATIEIALRNAANDNLTEYFGSSDWLINASDKFEWRPEERKKILSAQDNVRRSEYAKLSHSEKLSLDVLAYQNVNRSGISDHQSAKERQKYIAVTEGKIIAELTFYFWKRLYGPDYDQSLWRTTLKRTFPNKKLSRADVAIKLEQIYQSRNRLAHHEPVIFGRFYSTLTAIEFVSHHLEALHPSPTTPLANLLRSDLSDLKEKADHLHERLRVDSI